MIKNMELNIPIQLLKLQKKRNKPDKNGFKINDIVKIDMLKIDSKISYNDNKDFMYGIITHTSKFENDKNKNEIQYGLKILNKNKLESSYWVRKEWITLLKR